MAITKGIYICANEPTEPSADMFLEPGSFTSNNEQCFEIQYVKDTRKLFYNTFGDNSYEVYNYATKTWTNNVWKTIDLYSTNTGNDWFFSNYTKQKLSVDLTTLSGWANLSAGNHTIKIKAKGTSYKESELSAGVTVSKVAPNPNVGSVLSGNVGINEEFIATNDLTTYSNADQQTLTFINDYQTKELPELLTGLGFDLIQETTARDEEGTEYTETIDLNYWIKLTSTFSIFVVRNKITGVQRLDDNVSAYVISPDVVDKDLNKVKLIQVQPNHITALNTVKRSSSAPQDTLTPKTMKSGLSFLITRVTLTKFLKQVHINS